MFSLILSISAIALAALLAMATVYYGANAWDKATTRATAAKVINQSTQVLGAAELFYADHSRWPAGVSELLATEYLRENPTYLSHNSTPSNAVLAGWGLPLAYAQEFVPHPIGNESGPTPTPVGNESGPPPIHNGNESPSEGGTPVNGGIDITLPGEAPRWGAPVQFKPTYWLYKTASRAICQEVNFQTRGDNGVYAQIVPELVTQCFGLDAPFTVVTTRESSRSYWELLVQEWNADPEIEVSKTFNWSVKPTLVKTKNESGSKGYEETDDTNLLFNPKNPTEGGGGGGGFGPGDEDEKPEGNNPTSPGETGNGGGGGGGFEPVEEEDEDSNKGNGGSPDPDEDNEGPGNGGLDEDDSSKEQLDPTKPGGKENLDGLTEPKDTHTNWWFPNTRVGESSQKWVRIQNTGTSGMLMGTSLATLAAPFSVVSHDCPTTVFAGNSCVVLLQFTPAAVTQAGEHASRPFTIKTEDGENVFVLNGRGLEERKEGFTISPSPVVITPAYDGRVYSGYVTVKSTGNVDIAVDEVPFITDPSDVFKINSSSCAGRNMSKGQECAISFSMTAPKPGAYSATLTVSVHGFEDEVVPISANVLPGIQFTGKLTDDAFTDTLYSSVDLRSFVTVKNGKSLASLAMEMDVKGLPSGMSFNQSTGRIEGTPDASNTLGVYPLEVHITYGENRELVKYGLSLPLHASSIATWYLDDKLTIAGDALIGQPVDILTKSVFTEKAYLKSEAISKGGKLKGKFTITNNFDFATDAVRLSYLTNEGRDETCSGSQRDNYLAGCNNKPTVNAVGAAATMTRIHDKSVTAPQLGDLNLYLNFEPDADSAVKAPATPFVWTIKSTNDQTVVISEGVGNTASDAISNVDFGIVPAVHEDRRLFKRFYLRTGTAFGRAGGTWAISGSPEFKIVSVQTGHVGYVAEIGSSYHITTCSENRLTAHEAHCLSAWEATSRQYADLIIDVALVAPESNQQGVTDHEATLTFTPDEKYPVKALAPLSVNLKGQLKYENKAVLSATNKAVGNELLAEYDFGRLSHTKPARQYTTVYLMSLSDYGDLDGTWTLEGSSLFKISRVGAIAGSGTSSSGYNCDSGSFGPYTASCEAEAPQIDKNGGRNLMAMIEIFPAGGQTEPEVLHEAKLVFTPKHTKPIESEVPLEVKLTATTLATDSVIFTDSLSTDVADALSAVNFNEVQLTDEVEKLIFLRSQKGVEHLGGTFTLDGDDAFVIKSVRSASTKTMNGNQSCTKPTNTGATATCPATNSHPSSGDWSDIVVTLSFAPKTQASAGVVNYQSKLTFIPGSPAISGAAPLEVMLEGSSRYDQTVIIAKPNEAPTPADMVEFNVAPGKFGRQDIFARGSTMYGKVAGTWVVEGDAVFTIVSMYPAARNNGSRRTTTCKNSSLAIDRRTGYCEATETPVRETSASDIQVVLDITVPAGTPVGTEYKGKLTFIPEAKFPMEPLAPLEVELSGKVI